MDRALKHVSRLPSSAFVDDGHRSILSYSKLRLKSDCMDLHNWQSKVRSDSRWSIWQSVKNAETLFLFYEGSRISGLVGSLKPYTEEEDITYTCLRQINHNSLVLASSYFAVAEQSRVNAGEEDNFVKNVTEQWNSEMETEASTNDAVTPPKVEIDIFQDQSDSQTFLVLYYFKEEEEIQALRSSKTWISWRRSISCIIEGTPTVMVLRNVGNHLVSKSDGLKVAADNALTPEAPHHPPEFHIPGSEQVVENIHRLSADLVAYKDTIRSRYDRYVEKFESKVPSVSYHHYLPKRNADGSVFFRERYPGVKGLALIGSWTDWKEKFWFVNVQGTPDWELTVPDMPDGSIYKLVILTEQDTEEYKISPWTTKFIVHEDLVANSVLQTEKSPKHLIPLVSSSEKAPKKLGEYPRVYQVHVGRCVGEERIGTYDDVRTSVLPFAVAAGYNTLLLVGVQEHTYYPDAGWQVDSPISLCSRFGDRDAFIDLVNAAHSNGVKVCVQFVLSHMSAGVNTVAHLPGLCQKARYNDGLMVHPEWDGYVIDYNSDIACDYMVSAAEYWLETYGIDGFWFEGVPSVSYLDKAVNRFFNRFKFETYFDHNADIEGQAFLIHLTTRLRDLYSALHQNTATTLPILIASDYIGMPGVAGPILHGGLGFSYLATPHTRHALLNYNNQSVQTLAFELDRRTAEKRISSVDTLASVSTSKRSLRIAFFAWETLHTIAVGGIAPHVTELSAALRRVGHEVHIFTRATSAAQVTKVVHGVYYHEVPFQLDRDFVRECENMCGAFVQRLLHYESEAGWRFDICHGHDWLTARAVQSVAALGRTTVFTMHSTEAGRCGNKMFGGVSEQIRQLERGACHTAQRVICVSGVLADEVKSMYAVHSDKIRVTYNGCNVENFDGFEDAAPIKERYAIPAMDPTVLFVGRFVVQKGVDILVEAIPNILKFRSDIKFVVVGDGHMREEVERRAAQLGVAHAMRFVGQKGGAELKSLFKMTDVVIVPSRNEPFGIVVLEAWSCYKPVIATTNGGPRDFVSPFSDGLLIEPTADSISWGVCEAMKDFDRLRQWGHNGNRKVKECFSWTTIGSQTKNIYFELLNLTDCGYSYDASRGGSMAQHLVGDDLKFHMGVFDEEGDTKCGFTQLRLVTLLNESLAADAIMNLQGTEFGHPDGLDLPRPGNHFSMKQAITMMDLALRKELQFKHHLYFTTTMPKLIGKATMEESDDEIFVIGCYDRVLLFERAGLLFVFNLDNDRCYDNYVVQHRFGAGKMLKMILNTDMTIYGGWNRVPNMGPLFESDEHSRITITNLPSKFAVVLGSVDRPAQDPAVDIDTFIDEFSERMTTFQTKA